MALRVIPYQCYLFPLQDFPSEAFRGWDDGRESRTPKQWLEAIEGYCIWRAGSNWRRTSSKADRNNPDRWWYLHGARTVRELISADADAGRILPVLPPLHAVAPRDTRLDQLEAHNRAWLVEELLRSDPTLTNRTLLSHYSIDKLAHMVIAAWDRALPLKERSA